MGTGSNEPVYCGLNEPLAGLVKFYCKPSVTVLTLIKGMSVIFHQGLKQVLLKLCDFTVSSLKIVGSAWDQMNQFTGSQIGTDRNCWILTQTVVKMNIPL